MHTNFSKMSSTEKSWEEKMKMEPFKSSSSSDYRRFQSRVVIPEISAGGLDLWLVAPNMNWEGDQEFDPTNVADVLTEDLKGVPITRRANSKEISLAEEKWERRMKGFLATDNKLGFFYGDDVKKRLAEFNTIKKKLDYLDERFLGLGDKSSKEDFICQWNGVKMEGQAIMPEDDIPPKPEWVQTFWEAINELAGTHHGIHKDDNGVEADFIISFQLKFKEGVRSVPYFASCLGDMKHNPAKYLDREFMLKAAEDWVFSYRREQDLLVARQKAEVKSKGQSGRGGRFQKSTEKFQNPNAADAPCVIHLKGHHTNGQCLNQSDKVKPREKSKFSEAFGARPSGAKKPQQNGSPSRRHVGERPGGWGVQCGACGQHGHETADCKKGKCFLCGEVGHFKRDCPRRKHQHDDWWFYTTGPPGAGPEFS